MLLILICKDDLIFLFLYFHLTNIFLFRHGHKSSVVHFLYLPLRQPGHGKKVEEQQDQHDDHIVEDQGLFWLFYFLHNILLSKIVLDLSAYR